MELSCSVLVAEEHGLQDAPSLIERPTASGVVVGVARDVEIAPVLIGGEESRVYPFEIRHFERQLAGRKTRAISGQAKASSAKERCSSTCSARISSTEPSE
jgi:hypothetical protein